MQITWPESDFRRDRLTRLGREKRQVALPHEKLPDRDASARMKQYWTERLSALEDLPR
jgi:hypothetical protein